MRRAAVLLPLILAACVTVPEKIAMETEQLVTCADRQECDACWQRAQAWIAKNSSYLIQVATDSVLYTHPPMMTDLGPGYSLTKTPRADGSATIELTLYCPEVCNYPNEVASLRRYIAGH